MAHTLPVPLCSPLFPLVFIRLFKGASCLIRELPLCWASPGLPPPLSSSSRAQWPHERQVLWRRQSGRELGSGGACGRPSMKAQLPLLLSLSRRGRASLTKCHGPGWGPGCSQRAPLCRASLRGPGLKTGFIPNKELPNRSPCPAGEQVRTQGRKEGKRRKEKYEFLWDRKQGGFNHRVAPSGYPNKRGPVLTMVLTLASRSWRPCLLGAHLSRRHLSPRGAHSSSSY